MNKKGITQLATFLTNQMLIKIGFAAAVVTFITYVLNNKLLPEWLGF